MYIVVILGVVVGSVGEVCWCMIGGELLIKVWVFVFVYVFVFFLY